MRFVKNFNQPFLLEVFKHHINIGIKRTVIVCGEIKIRSELVVWPKPSFQKKKKFLYLNGGKHLTCRRSKCG